MRRNSNANRAEDDEITKKGKTKRNGSRNGHNKYDKRKSNADSNSRAKVDLSSVGRDNNPNWYFLDAGVADQVAQLSMREFAGKNLQNRGLNSNTDVYISVPALYTIYLNPAAGAANWVTELKNAGINQAGFRTFSKLAAFTGRALQYGPQDISIMILAFGEIISITEYLRRAFGLAYTYSQRNRAYPLKVLNAMDINANDLLSNYAQYRNRFNKAITRINQLPIPKAIQYFDKCASLYEKVYLDADSPMAQTIITKPYSTWQLDETSYEGGSILKTVEFAIGTVHEMSYYLDILDEMIYKMIESSSLNVVYADILNYFNKVGGEVWLFDYLSDGYQVIPEFNVKFCMQIHNAISTNAPTYSGAFTKDYTWVDGRKMCITPNNDVYADADTNSVIYGPLFDHTQYGSNVPVNIIIDFETANPSVEDRIENTRFTITRRSVDTIGIDSAQWNINSNLPDHYIVKFSWYENGSDFEWQVTSLMSNQAGSYRLSVPLSQLDWSPRIYYADKTAGAIDEYVLVPKALGDLNYYTMIDDDYLRPINQFVALALYDLR